MVDLDRDHFVNADGGEFCHHLESKRIGWHEGPNALIALLLREWLAGVGTQQRPRICFVHDLRSLHVAVIIWIKDLVVIALLRVQMLALHEDGVLLVINLVLDECFHPLHHRRGSDDEQSILIARLQQLVALAHEFEHAELMVAVDMSDEYDFGFQQAFSDQLGRAKVVTDLSVATLSAVHEYTDTLAQHVYGGGASVISRLHGGRSKEEHLSLVAV